MFIGLVTVGNSDKSEEYIVGVFSTISLAQHHVQLRQMNDFQKLLIWLLIAFAIFAGTLSYFWAKLLAI